MINADIVLMSGFPASGKSSLNEEYKNKGYIILCRDVLGVSMKEVASILDKKLKAWKFMKNDTKVVIDATFPTIETRTPFIKIAKKYNKSVGCHVMKTSKEDSLINAMLRVKKITGEFYFHKTELPSKYENNPQVMVYPAIFRHSKLIVKNKVSKNEGFDEVLFTNFERQYDESYQNKALFVDLDGTVRDTISDRKWPLTLNDQKILPNTIETLKKYKKQGYLIIGVSNQSSVNKGEFIDDVDDIIEETNQLVGGLIDDYRYCPHKIPSEICVCRKPQSGIGLYFMDKYKLNLRECIMVGDRTTDKTFATRLEMKYYDHKEFFDR